MDSLHHLSLAVHGLPPRIARSMHLALTYGSFRIGPKSWENDLTVCPVAAAAKVAGVWRDRAPMADGPEWGTPEEPGFEVEEFAACFDICCEDEGLDAAVHRVRGELELRLAARPAA